MIQSLIDNLWQLQKYQRFAWEKFIIKLEVKRLVFCY